MLAAQGAAATEGLTTPGSVLDPAPVLQAFSGERPPDFSQVEGPVRLRRWRSGPNTSVASRIHWISFGDLRQSTAEHIGCAGVSFMRAFRPPCQRTGAPVWDSQWPERRNLPRRGTPRRAPVCCGG